MAGKYLKGALVEFMPTFLGSVPNVIVFQYNPETVTHTWTPATPATDSEDSGSNPLAVQGLPGESFQFTIMMDAYDMIADGSDTAKDVASASGIYSRLAALEMLLYPTGAFEGSGLLGRVSMDIQNALGAATSGGESRPVPESQVPAVLLVWGAGRIVPVKVTSLSITEKLYDAALHPTHAEAQLGLKVLTPGELQTVTGDIKDLATAAYVYSQGLRQVLAVTNLANAAESIIGMLPV
jgi:hypothetical protein